jgi:hypothetical protein
LVEVNAPRHYYEAIDPATEGQRSRRARDEAIVETLATHYAGGDVRGLARDWARYIGTAWPRERGVPALDEGERPLRRALHKLSLLTDGVALSAASVARIAASH